MTQGAAARRAELEEAVATQEGRARSFLRQREALAREKEELLDRLSTKTAVRGCGVCVRALRACEGGVLCRPTYDDCAPEDQLHPVTHQSMYFLTL